MRDCRALSSEGRKSTRMATSAHWDGCHPLQSPSHNTPRFLFLEARTRWGTFCNTLQPEIGKTKPSQSRSSETREGLGTTGASRITGHMEASGTFRTGALPPCRQVRMERCLLLPKSRGRRAGVKGQPPAAEDKSQLRPQDRTARPPELTAGPTSAPSRTEAPWADARRHAGGSVPGPRAASGPA